MTPDQQREFWKIVHHILIVFDDWLCDTFGFSRKAKGKYKHLED
jgi:hypothetical protein